MTDNSQLSARQQWLKHSAKEAKLKKQIKDAEAELDDAAYGRVSRADRGRSQNAGRRRQVAHPPRRRRSRRDGSHEPVAHAASEGTGRALRHDDVTVIDPCWTDRDGNSNIEEKTWTGQ
jgi:hypothetical protein